MKAKLILVSLLLIALGVLTLWQYSYVFKKKIVGEIARVEQVEQSAMVIANGSVPTAQIRSFAVAVKNGSSGEIYTASTEDRQWIVAQKGQCAVAYFYPYPPWNLEKAGTYHNARLIHLCEDCNSGRCKEEITP